MLQHCARLCCERYIQPCSKMANSVTSGSRCARGPCRGSYGLDRRVGGRGTAGYVASGTIVLPRRCDRVARSCAATAATALNDLPMRRRLLSDRARDRVKKKRYILTHPGLHQPLL